MTHDLHDRLSALASTAAVAPLDMTVVARRAVARRRRARALTGVVAVAVLAAGTAAAMAVARPRTDALQPADGRETSAPAPAAPSERALRDVLDTVLPGSEIHTATEYRAGYLAPGTSAFADRNRLGRVVASVELPDRSGVGVAWDRLDRPLDADEAERFVGFGLEYDDTQPKPEQRLLRREDAGLSGLRLYRVQDRLGAGFRLAAWAANGVNVVLTRQVSDDENADARLLLDLARALTADAPAGTPEARSAGARSLRLPSRARVDVAAQHPVMVERCRASCSSGRL